MVVVAAGDDETTHPTGHYHARTVRQKPRRWPSIAVPFSGPQRLPWRGGVTASQFQHPIVVGVDDVEIARRIMRRTAGARSYRASPAEATWKPFTAKARNALDRQPRVTAPTPRFENGLHPI